MPTLATTFRALLHIANEVNTMSHNRGLTMVEALVVMVALTILVAILLPLFQSHTGQPPRMRSNTQLRGIHQAMVMYAHMENNRYFPGLDDSGQPIDLSVEQRMKMLIDANYFTPEYVVSPIDESNRTKQPWVAGSFTSDHYSYAMLQVPASGGRYDEWFETLNTQAIVMSDRNTGTAATPMSIHTTRPGDWRGGVVRNDNSVSFETTHLHRTRYGNGPERRDDHLFEAVSDDDAYLIHSGN